MIKNNPISYMAKNHVAANLLMLLLIIGGIFTAINIKQEVFPEIELDMVRVSVAYSGAGPEEVEEGILLKIEEALSSLDGVKKIESTANEGSGSVVVTALDGADIDQLLAEVKSEVDRLSGFPEDAEEPIISKISRKRSVLTISLYGNIPLLSLRDYAEEVRDELLKYDDITQVEMSATADYEIGIEIPEVILKKYGLKLTDVASIIQANSIDVPAGSVKEESGEILLRTKSKKYKGSDYKDIVIISDTDGTKVKLGDIAVIKDGFKETDLNALYNGKHTINLEVYRVGEQKPIDIANEVKKYVAEKNITLPENVKLQVWHDRSEILKDRMKLLMKNAYFGLVLVLIVLAVFLQFRLAFWTAMGIPISFLGAFLFMPHLDVSVNMISLFAFIMALGIVVDDAIIVGENIYYHRKLGKSPIEAAYDGTVEVLGAVTFSVLTTMAAFAPMIFVEGRMGKFIWVVPAVVISVLAVSLLEAFFILPAHMSRVPKPKDGGRRARFNQKIDDFIHGPYKRFVAFCVHYRYIVIAMSVVTLFLTVATVKSGMIKFRFFPAVESDSIVVSLRMPVGTPVEITQKYVDVINKKGDALIKEYDSKRKSGTIFRNRFTVVGSSYRGGSASSSNGYMADIVMYLQPAEIRKISSIKFLTDWRKSVGNMPGAESLTFTSRMMDFGDAIDIQLSHKSFDVLNEASSRLKASLANYNGVTDIEDSYSSRKQEIRFNLTPLGKSLGLTENELARQVRAAFYGIEALSFQKGRNETDVTVRYPKEDRYNITSLRNLMIRTGSQEVPFSMVATAKYGLGFSTIHRTEGRRTVNVTADVSDGTNPEEVIKDVIQKVVPQLQADYPGLEWALEGESEEQKDSMQSLAMGFLFAILVIYALLAIPFRSYIMPFIVMSAIPFGVVGAVIGHIIMGYDLSMLSMFGTVALSGVVINDALVLLTFVQKRQEEQNQDALTAVIEASARRFRPIILTSLTTFFGLMPMIFETSRQAKFLIPMAISLGFGILVATVITLFLVPSIYMMMRDIKHFVIKPIASIYKQN